MKSLSDKKGQVRVIEAIFATILLMSCLSLIPASTSVKDSTINLASTAQNILLSFDGNGHIAALIDNQNWTSLKECLESSLPLTVWYNLTVFDKNMRVLNPFPISNAGTVSDKIISIDYICASQSSTYDNIHSAIAVVAGLNQMEKRNLRQNNSGQVIIITALLVVTLLLSTAIYIIETEKECSCRWHKPNSVFN